jgi:phosphoribosylaminoimidazole-succinocarboxamide synthase
LAKALPILVKGNTIMFQFDSGGALMTTNLPFPKHSGKVRDVYDLGDQFLIVSTDRISAFDYVLPSGIPDKGRVLTATSEFWFSQLSGIRHHWITGDLPPGLLPDFIDPSPLAGRSMIVRKAAVVPYECVVRGYLEGSGLTEYQKFGQICGIELPSGLVQCDRLPEPIFTPATKAVSGHDENIPWQRMADDIGPPLANELRSLSLNIFSQASAHAQAHGILIADTKFEFGFADGELILVDEVLTPDSSRFWPAADYHRGQPQQSFDKQFVREWLMDSGWDRESPPPALPTDVILRTREKYLEAYQMLAGRQVPSIYVEP